MKRDKPTTISEISKTAREVRAALAGIDPKLRILMLVAFGKDMLALEQAIERVAELRPEELEL